MEESGDGINEFLQRIRELGDKRDREDNERARKLEEEIIAGREARRARRDERARSLSPQKDSPLGTPISLRSVVDSRPGTRDGEETGEKNGDAYTETLDKLSGKISSITTDNPEATSRQQETSRTPTHTPTRTPTLSWQRRPKSMVSMSPSSRPSALIHKQEDSQDEEESEKTRSQIALNLGSKDPSWFRQTADRGAISAALKKAEEASMESPSKMALPGMSNFAALAGRFERERAITPEPEKGSPIPGRSSEEPQSAASILSRRDSLRSLDRNSPSSPTSGLGLRQRHRSLTTGGSLRLDYQLFGKDSNPIDFSRPPGMSPTQAQMSPDRSERATSPTKGFVQSAMLRREGSINKRWSNSHQTGSLSRNGSTASTSQNQQRVRDSRPSNLARKSSPAFEAILSADKKKDANDEDTVTRSRAASIADSISKYSTTGTVVSDSPSLDADDDQGTSTSPTKFDQKRWSRAKSSWLETALKKGTESPQPTPPPKPVGKLQDLPQLKPVVISKPSEISGTSSRPPINPKPLNVVLKPVSTTASTAPTSIKPTTVEKPTPTSASTPPVSKPTLEQKPGTLFKPVLASSAAGKAATFDKASFSTRPTHGSRASFDLRAGLKSRQPVESPTEKQKELPFLSAMSKLKSTRTQNYVPQDQLKDHIIAGKANLQSTGGPQRNNSPDPLKEKLIFAKVALRHSPSNSVSSPSPTEALRPKSQPVEFAKQILPPVKPEPGKLNLGKKGSSLTERFNPNLANFLQRGPPPAAMGKSSVSTSSNGRSSSEGNSETAEESEQTSGRLTHMTKDRARGPKRRSPTKPEASKTASAAATPFDIPQSRTPIKEKPLPPVKRTPSPRPAEVRRKPSSVLAPPKMADLGSPSASSTEAASLPSTPQKSDKLKPPTPAKSPLLRTASCSSLREKAQAQSSPVSSATQRSASVSLTALSPYSSRAVSRESSKENLSLSSPSAAKASGEIQSSP
ncbi:hypothetical protein RUND412_008707 [Rhizina undulata]